MANVRISQLPLYTGNTSGSWFIINNSGQTETFKIQLETILQSGTSGTSGTSGSNGSSGTSGINGTSGTSGTSGSNGSSGTSGSNGSSGTSGSSGSNGSSGTSGSSGVSGTSGTSGDSIFAQTGSIWNTTRNIGITGSLLTNQLWITTTGGGVGGIISYDTGSQLLSYSANGNSRFSANGEITIQSGPLSNRVNINNNTNITGSLFVTSIPSGSSSNQVVVYNTSTNQLERRTDAGTSGTSGTSGSNGSSGTSGSNGSSGTSGVSGTSGTSGVSGTSGTSGINGTSGTSGVSGTSGTSGSSGVSGTSGTSGSSGVSGTSGTSGSSGVNGINGTSGTSGVSGTSGTSGISGTSGTSGSSGVNGTSGTSGVSGSSGTSGSSGISGTSGTSGAATITNNVNNYVLTATGTSDINGESNLRFDGSILSVTGSVEASGNVVAYTTSDERQKLEIKPIENALDKVMKLNGVTWKWNESNTDYTTQKLPTTGLIAQQVREVLPEVVKEKLDGYLALDYEKMIGLLVEAIKELRKEIK